MDEFEKCYDEERYQDEIDQDIALGGSYDVNATPSIYLDGTIVLSATPNQIPDFDEIAAAIEAAMNQ